MSNTNGSAAIPQPKPQMGDTAVAPIVIDDIKERVKMGRKKYGTFLRINNGRDAKWDLYQELIDACMYIRQSLLEEQSAFVDSFNSMAQQIHQNAVDKGFWDDSDRNDAESIALMHSELSEALEGMRHGNPPSDKIPDFSAIEEELADVIIRIMDMAPARGWRIAEAIESKMAYNAGRPHKHGKEF